MRLLWGFFPIFPLDAKMLWDWEGMCQPFMTEKTNLNMFCNPCKVVWVSQKHPSQRGAKPQ